MLQFAGVLHRSRIVCLLVTMFICAVVKGTQLSAVTTIVESASEAFRTDGATAGCHVTFILSSCLDFGQVTEAAIHRSANLVGALGEPE